MYKITLRLKEVPKPIEEMVEGFEQGPTAITLYESEGKFSIIPLASLVYMDVEVIADAEGQA